MLLSVVLGICTREMETYVDTQTRRHTHTSTQMLIAAFFVLSPHWKQATCPSVGEWLNKLCIPWNTTQMQQPGYISRELC